MSQAQVSYVGADLAPIAVAQVAYLGADSSNDSYAQVAYLGGATTLAEADAGPDLVDIRPLTTVLLTTGGAAGSFAQVSGPTVTITGSAPTQRYVAPASMTGAVLVFEITVTDGSDTATDQCTHTVLPHQWWQIEDGAPAAVIPYVNQGPGVAPPQPSFTGTAAQALPRVRQSAVGDTDAPRAYSDTYLDAYAVEFVTYSDSYDAAYLG
jgi:hypothetical protein